MSEPPKPIEQALEFYGPLRPNPQGTKAMVMACTGWILALILLSTFYFAAAEVPEFPRLSIRYVAAICLLGIAGMETAAAVVALRSFRLAALLRVRTAPGAIALVAALAAILAIGGALAHAIATGLLPLQ